MIADAELASAINATAGAIMIRNYFALFNTTPRIGIVSVSRHHLCIVVYIILNISYGYSA